MRVALTSKKENKRKKEKKKTITKRNLNHLSSRRKYMKRKECERDKNGKRKRKRKKIQNTCLDIQVQHYNSSSTELLK